jgi:hypothetical protein
MRDYLLNNLVIAGGVAQEVRHLPSKLEALSSNCVKPKKKADLIESR